MPSRSLGGPQIPGPVIRMAPKPMRSTSMSPMRMVPAPDALDFKSLVRHMSSPRAGSSRPLPAAFPFNSHWPISIQSRPYHAARPLWSAKTPLSELCGQVLNRILYVQRQRSSIATSDIPNWQFLYLERIHIVQHAISLVIAEKTGSFRAECS